MSYFAIFGQFDTTSILVVRRERVNTIWFVYSLLGMLAGRTNNDWMEGDIFLNGEQRKESFRLQCGFVVQVLGENPFCKSQCYPLF